MFCRLVGCYIIPFIRVAVIDLSSEKMCYRLVGHSRRYEFWCLLAGRLGCSFGYSSKRVEFAFKWHGSTLALVCSLLCLEASPINFHFWSVGAIKVFVDCRGVSGCIIRGTDDACSNVLLPSFDPLLFAVCWKAESFFKCKFIEYLAVVKSSLVVFAVEVFDVTVHLCV